MKLQDIKWVDGNPLETLELVGIMPVIGMARQAGQEIDDKNTAMANMLLNAIELQLEEVSKTLLRLSDEVRANPGDPRLYRLKALVSDMMNTINNEKPEPKTSRE